MLFAFWSLSFFLSPLFSFFAAHGVFFGWLVRMCGEAGLFTRK